MNLIRSLISLSLLIVLTTCSNPKSGSASATEAATAVNASQNVTPREATQTEKDNLKRFFTHMKVDDVRVTGEADARYNCFASTLGIYNRNIPSDNTKFTRAEVDALYQRHGYRRTSNPAEIAILGLGDEEIFHACRFNSLTGKWESKLGKGLRILHDLSDVTGLATDQNPEYYGQVLNYYTRN